MCHLLVEGLSKHIWSLSCLCLCSNTAGVWLSLSFCPQRSWLACHHLSSAVICCEPGCCHCCCCLVIIFVKICVVFTWVVFGFICRVAELNVKVDAENGVVAVVPRDCGERDAGLDKGLMKGIIFAQRHPCLWLLCGLVSLLYKDATMSWFSACISTAKHHRDFDT